MDLQNAVPWGRSLEEYKDIFSLSEADLQKRIIGCSDGPASFNCELTKRGGDVTSIDPVYHFTKDEIQSRISEVYDEIIPQMEKNRDAFLWSSIRSVEELGDVRMKAMNDFLEDYESGKESGRYVDGSLPTLPFETNEFDLALCSHFLFLYSEQFTEEFHIDAVKELCRVAKEVRVYPLIDLKNRESEHLGAVIAWAKENGYSVETTEVSYRFQKGAEKMLVLKEKI